MILEKIKAGLISWFFFYMVFLIFGMDLIYAENNILGWRNVKTGLSEGFVYNGRGFLIRIDSSWFGIVRNHRGLIDMPFATWPIIGATIAVFWNIIFNWEQRHYDEE